MALWLPPEHRGRLAAYLLEAGRRAPGFRWVAPEGLHLTLRFLGSLPEDRLAAVRSELSSVRGAPFALALGGLGSFGRASASRVVWLGLKEGAAVAAQLAAEVELACRQAGLEPDPRRWNPHVTLGRARARAGEPFPALPPLPALEPWVALEMILFESRPGRRSAGYEPLARYPLSG